MRYCYALLSTLLVIAPPSAKAQIAAIITDSRTISEAPGGKIDTAFTHIVSARAMARMEHPGEIRSDIRIMSMTDSGLRMMFIDTSRKIFRETKWSGGWNGLTVVVMPRIDKAEIEGDTVTVDSVGAGPVIQGHPTLHFRMHSSTRITTVTAGDTSRSTRSVTSDLYLAPEVKAEQRDSSEDFARWIAMRVQEWVPPAVRRVLEGQHRIQASLSKYGTNLRTITETRETSSDGTVTHRQTIDILRHDRMTVPASTFLPPPGYKKFGSVDSTKLR
jgi:hypothetical protein